MPLRHVADRRGTGTLRESTGGHVAKPFNRAGSAAVAKALEFAGADSEAFIDVCYHAILGRAPDAQGLQAYSGMIARSPDRETLIAVVRSIAMSEEARKYRDHHLAQR